jgi:hypothetical protein
LTQTPNGQKLRLIVGMEKENAQLKSVPELLFGIERGLPVVPMRWVLVRDPDGKFAAQARLSTNQEYKPQQILEWFVRRC